MEESLGGRGLTRRNEDAAKPDREIRFGPFCLHPALQVLFEDDTQVQIGIRTLTFLITLVERAGELVTKDELFARVWPGLTVEEGNLRSQMALLRKALRDGEAGTRYVVTVPGTGYRFVAPVSKTEPSIPNPPWISLLESNANLPTRLTRLIGRENAIADVIDRLEKHRFLTIAGPGGIGKTSVALAAAARAARSYRDGAYLVDCAPLLANSSVSQKLASTLGLEISASDPTRGLGAYLHGKQMLIVLDSCERVVDGTAALAEKLLMSAPSIGILTTSREPLRADGENIYRLSPLEFPASCVGLTATDALNYPAIQLFVERVAASLGEFKLRDADAPVVAEICRRLDGIALAIELAAGRVDVFGLQGVAERLKDRVRLLTHGRRTALPRHKTLAAMFDWSYDTLSKLEQAALYRLSVFVGGFTLDAAEAVAADDLLPAFAIPEIVTSLVSKSLLIAHVATTPGHYRPLDTTRAYALKKLAESGEHLKICLLHGKYIQNMLDQSAIGGAALSISAAKLLADSRLADEARAILE